MEEEENHPLSKTKPVVPFVDLSHVPTMTYIQEMVQLHRNRALMRLVAYNGVLDFHAQMAMLEPENTDPKEVLDIMRKSAELAADLANGRIALTVQAKIEEVGDKYLPTNDECVQVMEAIFEEVAGGTINLVPAQKGRDFTPNFKNRTPKKPVQKNLKGRQGATTPPLQEISDTMPEQLIEAKQRDTQTRRTLKIRKVVKPSAR